MSGFTIAMILSSLMSFSWDKCTKQSIISVHNIEKWFRYLYFIVFLHIKEFMKILLCTRESFLAQYRPQHFSNSCTNYKFSYLRIFLFMYMPYGVLHSLGLLWTSTVRCLKIQLLISPKKKLDCRKLKNSNLFVLEFTSWVKKQGQITRLTTFWCLAKKIEHEKLKCPRISSK